MRFAYPLVLLVFLAFVTIIWVSTTIGVDPTSEAQRFMQDIEQGNVVDAVKQFGSNMCHCPAKGGWVSYLIYQSGQEHNLAFMLGHPFEKGTPNATPVPNEREALLPWQRPEDYVVDYPISFNANSYQPYFLPLKMAYGKDMTSSEFDQFLKDPDKDSWKGFTLRLRAGLAKGVVEPPVIEVPSEMKTDFQSYKKVEEELAFNRQQAIKNNKSNKTDLSSRGGKSVASEDPKSESAEKSDSKTSKTDTSKVDSKAANNDGDVSEEYIRKSFGDAAAEYMIPQDAGRVLDADGNPLSEQAIAAKLPRLKKMTLRLHIVRRDKIQDWTIYHFALEHPILLLRDGSEIALEHHQRPKNSQAPTAPTH